MPNLLKSVVYFQADLCSETGGVKIPGQGAVRWLWVSQKNKECPETVGTSPSCLGKSIYFMEGLQGSCAHQPGWSAGWHFWGN